jgi:ferredoxin-type protein NapF
MQRRELFSSLASSIKNATKEKPEKLVRPPYNDDETLFHNECDKCDAKCATVCEEKIIKIATDATPYLDFSNSGCAYCDKCAAACEFGVLTLEKKSFVGAKVTIDQSKCYSWQGVMCFSCKDPCLEDAIDFKAMFMPVINDKCTSCGFCVSRCPAQSIMVEAF